MRRYARFRFVLLATLLGVLTLVVSTSFAADTGAAPAGEKKEIKTSLFKIILDSRDFVTYTVLALSIVAVTLIIQAFIRARRSVMMPDATVNHIRDLIGQRQFKELIEFTEADPSFVSKALNPALKRAPSFAAMKEAMETSIGEQTAEQFRKIEYLNIIGNLGPLLGLLGTVIGMIHAFQAMNLQEGAADPATLSGGVSKALAHTMIGLILALPCLAAFGILRTIVDRLTVEGALIAEELLLMVKPSEAKPAAAAAVAAGMPARPTATPQPAAAPRKAPPGAPVPPPAPAKA